MGRKQQELTFIISPILKVKLMAIIEKHRKVFEGHAAICMALTKKGKESERFDTKEHERGYIYAVDGIRALAELEEQLKDA